MTSFKTIILALAGVSFVQTSMAAPIVNQTNLSAQNIGTAMMQLNAASLLGNTSRQYNDIWARMRSGFEMTEVNPEIVRRHEQYFSSKSTYVNRTIDRSSPYMYYILSEVEKRGMPSEIALLPFIESAYVTKAKSPVGASGLWQFMPATGRQYGLAQNAMYDGRHDITASTDAALNYLQYLYGLFGDWSLALAAYNWGEGNVGKAVARAQSQGLSPVYENLRMPDETRNYVPKLLAIRNLVANPEGYNVSISRIDNKPYFEVIDVNTPMDIKAAAHLAGITEAEFIRLNPGFNLPVFMPSSSRKMALPSKSVKTFYSNLKQADNSTLLSWDIYTPISKESISNIASNYGMSAAELRSLNLLRSTTLNAGQSILVAKNTGIPNISVNDQLADFNLMQSDPILVAASQNRNINNTAIAATPTISQQVVTTLVSAPIVEQNTNTQVAVAQTLTNTTQATQPTSNIATSVRNFSGFEDTPPTVKHIASSDPLLALINEQSSTFAPANSETVVDFAASQLERDKVRQANIQAQHAARQAQLDLANEEAKQKRIMQAQAKALQNKFTGKHAVASGDTLTNIAKRYNMSLSDLMAVNQISGETIRLGETLKVAAVAPAKVEKNNKQETNYVVKKGDTLTSIAGRYNVQVNDIQKWNKSSNNLRPGQKIKLYGL